MPHKLFCQILYNILNLHRCSIPHKRAGLIGSFVFLTLFVMYNECSEDDEFLEMRSTVRSNTLLSKLSKRMIASYLFGIIYYRNIVVVLIGILIQEVFIINSDYQTIRIIRNG